MPVYKALPVVLILGLIVFTGVFYFMEDLRPPFVERMFLQAQGLGPATTPSDCLDKFRKAIRKRNYKAAATFCGGEFAEELTRASKMAKRLGDAVEELLHNVKVVAAINAPAAEVAVAQLYPFPNDFNIPVLNYKEGDEQAYAVLDLGAGKPYTLETLRDNLQAMAKYKVDPRIRWAAAPKPWLGEVLLKQEGDKQKIWKIFFPAEAVSGDWRLTIQYLKDNGGNYVRALDNVKYAIKHDAATKQEFETELVKQLGEAK